MSRLRAWAWHNPEYVALIASVLAVIAFARLGWLG
jgi:hypothetical protein